MAMQGFYAKPGENQMNCTGTGGLTHIKVTLV
mgnify:CR=1 FL=1